MSILDPAVNSFGKLIFTISAVILGALPECMREFVAGTNALVLFAVSPEKRKNVRENLSVIGGNANHADVLRVFTHHSKNMVDIFASSRRRPASTQERFRFEGRSALDRALSHGRGVILATVHVGNWELAALHLASLGYRLNVVAGVQMNRLLTEAVKEAKQMRGITVINPDDSYRKIFRALASNEIVALLVDGDVYVQGVEVSLFKKRVLLPSGAISLSRKTGAPVVGGYCRRLQRGRYRICIEPILSGADTATLTETEALETLYDRIERYIRDNNSQWCIFRKFWKETG